MPKGTKMIPYLFGSFDHVKNCFLSSNGKLIAIHNGTKIMLYSLEESKVEFLCSVFES